MLVPRPLTSTGYLIRKEKPTQKKVERYFLGLLGMLLYVTSLVHIKVIYSLLGCYIRNTKVARSTAEAMNFCATPGIDQWLGELLNDPRGAGFAKRLLLQDGFLDGWTADLLLFRCKNNPSCYIS